MKCRTEEARAFIVGRQSALEALERGPAFQKGQRVSHRVFGLGTILAVDEGQHAYVVKFDEMATTRHIAFRVAMEPVEK